MKTKVSEANELVKEIHASMKDIPFWRLHQLIKKNGEQCVRECFHEAQGGDNPTALFLWMLKKYQTKFM